MTTTEARELATIIATRPSITAAQDILAAGYRKPDTITTAEELDALPNESIIKTRLGTTWEAMKATTGETFWRTFGPAKVLTSEVLGRGNLPATVLYVPESLS